MTKKIGFIGQGWIGRNYANDFEARGYEVVRYDLKEPYCFNKEKISECDIVFIAVPTPTSKRKFNDSIVREVIKLIGEKKTAVIKSTILPGTTESIQKENPDIFVLHSPEFLVSANAAYDAAHPTRNIIGIPSEAEEFKKAAREVMEVLPPAAFEAICKSKDAELIKYSCNCFLYMKVIYANIINDLAQSLGCDWELIRDAIASDPRIGSSHMEPIHESGRGAGGHCFIKDYEAFTELYNQARGNDAGALVLNSLKNKNLELLVNSGKNFEMLKEVYGEDIIDKYKK